MKLITVLLFSASVFAAAVPAIPEELGKRRAVADLTKRLPEPLPADEGLAIAKRLPEPVEKPSKRLPAPLPAPQEFPEPKLAKRNPEPKLAKRNPELKIAIPIQEPLPEAKKKSSSCRAHHNQNHDLELRKRAPEAEAHLKKRHAVPLQKKDAINPAPLEKRVPEPEPHLKKRHAVPLQKKDAISPAKLTPVDPATLKKSDITPAVFPHLQFDAKTCTFKLSDTETTWYKCSVFKAICNGVCDDTCCPADISAPT